MIKNDKQISASLNENLFHAWFNAFKKTSGTEGKFKTNTEMRSSTNEKQSSSTRILEFQATLCFDSKKSPPFALSPPKLNSLPPIFLSSRKPKNNSHLGPMPLRTAHPSESYLVAQEQLLLGVARKNKKNKIKPFYLRGSTNMSFFGRVHECKECEH